VILKMGYYSTIKINFRIEDYEGLEKSFQELEKLGLITLFHTNMWFHIIVKDDDKITDKKLQFLSYIKENLRFYVDGSVKCVLDYDKWYYDDNLARFLAPFVSPGGTMEFIGEDGERWGYEFRNGKAFLVNWVRQVTELSL